MPITCSHCHGNFAESDLISWGEGFVCNACKPGAIQKLKEGGIPSRNIFAFGRMTCPYCDESFLPPIKQWILIPFKRNRPGNLIYRPFFDYSCPVCKLNSRCHYSKRSYIILNSLMVLGMLPGTLYLVSDSIGDLKHILISLFLMLLFAPLTTFVLPYWDESWQILHPIDVTTEGKDRES
ncbi:MAG: hypothetical protein HRT89_01380 [Lentisphaeria bacterium]|nr:hypothetical protein [Lentisphaeria bacterium]NQZ66697.1 hypothetical protein [Lentisphaeria bacterium]